MLRKGQLPTVAVIILVGCMMTFTARGGEQIGPPGPAESPLAVTILSPDDGALVRERRVDLALHVSNPGPETVELQVLVDGRPGQTPRGVELVAARPGSGDAVTHRIGVIIPAMDCLVAVYAVTAQGRRATAAIRLRWQGVPPPVPKPKLYVLAVGVTDYERPELRLRYPAKDARDLATVLTEQAGKLYGAVETRILTDRDATRANVLDGLQWLERQTTAHDVAVLFLGGHGLNDPATGEYYYLPADSDPAAIKRTMIPGTTFQTSLRSIAGRVVLFLDTCHAGNVLGKSWQLRGDPDLQAVVNELASDEAGVVVFTASMRRQSAKESPDWGNGAFTKAVVEGLRGQASAVQKGLRPITITMLDAYISQRVKELTQGTQAPTTAKPSTLADFPLVVIDGVSVPPQQLDEPRPTRRRRRGLQGIALGADVMIPLQQDNPFSFQLWSHLALSFKVAGQENSSLAIRLAGGPVAGQAVQTFLAPDGTVVEADSHILYGALFELGLQLRLLQQRTVRPSFETGLLLGGAGYVAPTATPSTLLLSLPVRARLSLGSGPHALAIVLGVVVDWAANRYHYTGAGAAFVAEGRTWALQGTLGVAYEYKTKRVE